MKNVLFFFGSFDPIHLGHIQILKESIKKAKIDVAYVGLNLNSITKKLTPFYHRKKMLKLVFKNNKKIKVLDFAFNYNDLDSTYSKIFNLVNENVNPYILIGQDQYNNLVNWYKFDLIKEKFKFIIALRDKYNCYIDDEYLFINHKFKNISSYNIRNGDLSSLNRECKQYIFDNNLYLDKVVSKYLSNDRYLHSLSVTKLALYINKKANLNISKNKIIKACMLHDIAKEKSKDYLIEIMNKYYKSHIREKEDVYHQYVGEYIAKKDFMVKDKCVLEAIKFHTTGTSNMSDLAKLVYVCDKMDPLRGWNSKANIDLCVNDFDKGFETLLKDNYDFLLEKGKDINNINFKKCIKYYLT